MKAELLAILVVSIGLVACVPMGGTPTCIAPAAGCTPVVPRTCDELGAANLRKLLDQPSNPEDSRATIAAMYGIPVDQIMMTSSQAVTNLSWKSEAMAIEGVMSFRLSHASGIGLDYRQRAPTGDSLIACLGTPDLYGVFFRGPGPGGPDNLLIVDLYFLQYAMRAGAVLHVSGRVPPKLSGSIPVDSFGFVPTGSRDDILRRLTSADQSFQQQRKPWPGKWEDLVVDVDPRVR